MNLLEYQAKALLAEAGISVPRSKLAATAAEASCHAAELGPKVAVKAQVRTGGRGRAGGVEVVGDREAAHVATERILLMEIKGHRVSEVLVEEAANVAEELYVALLLDREAKCVTALLSARGGMAIEDLAAEHPEELARVHVPPLLGWRDYLARRLCLDAGLDRRLLAPMTTLLRRLWEVYCKHEAMLVEVNPLGIDDTGGLIALDAKITVDDNALYRHLGLARLATAPSEQAGEEKARAKGLSYVSLDGNIGIIGNGAGLVMSTLDAVMNAGGAPANFLDLGGGATAERMVAALEVVTSNARVDAVFLNIFGGITRCDEVARGLAEAMQTTEPDLPIVVRLDGTNAQEGLAILESMSHPNLHVAPTMREAANRAVALCVS
jgi:succinyl-CoA synthetase beta subunit